MVCMCGSAAINHATGDPEHMFSHQLPPVGQQLVTIGDGTTKKVIFVGTLNLNLHWVTDVRAQLPWVCVVEGLAINLLSIHAVQANHAVTLNSTRHYR